MTAQEWLAQVNGTMEVILLACTSMIATHPEKEKVLALLQGLTGPATDAPEDTPEKRSHKLGMRTAIATLGQGVATAQLAEEVRSLKKESGSH